MSWHWSQYTSAASGVERPCVLNAEVNACSCVCYVLCLGKGSICTVATLIKDICMLSQYLGKWPHCVCSVTIGKKHLCYWCVYKLCYHVCSLYYIVSLVSLFSAFIFILLVHKLLCQNPQTERSCSVLRFFLSMLFS